MGAETRPETTTTRRARLAAEQEREPQRQSRRRLLRTSAVTAALLIAVTGGLYAVFNRAEQPSASGASYDVGTPGPGQAAPAFSLASTSGGRAGLAQWRDKTVLLYFQEGLTCQPCWDQIRDLESASEKVKAAGVDEIVSITTDPAGLVARKVKDEKLSTPVLSDPDLRTSKAYRTNEYGMMGASRNGHSFVLVGPDGKIQWRADYGGAPKYTMYVPADTILADLKAGRRA